MDNEGLHVSRSAFQRGVGALDCTEEGVIGWNRSGNDIAKSTSTLFDTIGSIQPVFVFYMQAIIPT